MTQVHFSLLSRLASHHICVTCDWMTSATFQVVIALNSKHTKFPFSMFSISNWIGTVSKHTSRQFKFRKIDNLRRRTSDLTTSDAQRKTIYALSTPPGKGGVAIVRVSGPDALHVWNRMVRSHNADKPITNPKPWKVQRCRIVHPENESLIDDGLAIYFRGVFRNLLLSHCGSCWVFGSPVFVYDKANGRVAYTFWTSISLGASFVTVLTSNSEACRARRIHSTGSARRPFGSHAGGRTA